LVGGIQSGAVIELGYRAGENLRFGAGYNFSKFSDDERARFDDKAGGPFLRVTGLY